VPRRLLLFSAERVLVHDDEQRVQQLPEREERDGRDVGELDEDREDEVDERDADRDVGVVAGAGVDRHVRVEHRRQLVDAGHGVAAERVQAVQIHRIPEADQPRQREPERGEDDGIRGRHGR
jgi:hypothetical protein